MEDITMQPAFTSGQSFVLAMSPPPPKLSPPKMSPPKMSPPKISGRFVVVVVAALLQVLIRTPEVDCEQIQVALLLRGPANSDRTFLSLWPRTLESSSSVARRVFAVAGLALAAGPLKTFGGATYFLGSGFRRDLASGNHSRSLFSKLAVSNLLAQPEVAWASVQTARKRHKRSVLEAVKVERIQDPAYPQQWHLHNKRTPGMDVNVIKVWSRGLTGSGMTGAILDDGVQWRHPDLAENYDPESSWDFNDDDPDPAPDPAAGDHHGTRCAGEFAASSNHVCGVGVAFGANISALRILAAPITDFTEATAFRKFLHRIDVYSCSWGPKDSGATVEGPRQITRAALRYAVEHGRSGFGSVVVVASGNGGRKGDNCNYDGYANSIYTVTIGAVDEFGRMPSYAERCASMLAVTMSSGDGYARNVVTTDWSQRIGHQCTDSFSGTSAAAPLAAGVVTLTLQARPCLGWRDVQHLIAVTSRKVDVAGSTWTRNSAGLEHSHEHGFGLLDAWRMVLAAKVWQPVPWMTVYVTEELSGASIGSGASLTVRHLVSPEETSRFALHSLEYVQVVVSVATRRRGDLQLELTCPSGTKSELAAPRPLDTSSAGLRDWSMASVRCWGEPPHGEYVLVVSDVGRPEAANDARLLKWQLKLFGSAISADEFQQRKRSLFEKMETLAESLLNESVTCPPAPEHFHLHQMMSPYTLKVFWLAGVWCFLMSLNAVAEVACEDDEDDEDDEDAEDEDKLGEYEALAD